MNTGLRISGDQRQITSALPMHLVDVLNVGDGVQTFVDPSGMVDICYRSMDTLIIYFLICIV